MSAPRTGADCVIVGGGPGGMVLAYLLGRSGVPVTVLEAHQDFDREFRGDSLHPYTLELLDQLDIADELLALPHHKARFFRLHTPAGTITTTDYGKIPSRFNYVALMRQAQFLDFLAQQIESLPHCEVRTGCRVTDLLREPDGRIRGVRYRDSTGHHDKPAALVVAADGRFSKLRRLADLPARSLGATTDLLWFTLPHHDSDPPGAGVDVFFGRDHYIGLLTGTAGWQVGYTLPKGGYAAARDAGVEPIRRAVATLVPWLADRVNLLTDMAQTTLLSVDISRVDTWWRPGLLLIGDAAHVISPVGGNGILMAVQDAVTAANHLTTVLGTGRTVPDAVLAAIQAEREPAIRQVQSDQTRIERRAAAARESGRSIAPPALLRVITAIPAVRRRAATANAYGPMPPQLEIAVLAKSTMDDWETPPRPSVAPALSRAAEVADTVADRSVILGYSRVGYWLRRHAWPVNDPTSNALVGRTALVTGANSGIGLAAAAGMARLGARVVLVVRDEDRGHHARNRILRQVPEADLVVARCDMADLADITRFAADARTEWPTIDVLVHNAGVLPAQRQETPQGHEVTLSTHVLGPLLLTEQLRPALKASTDARVVFVSSGGMYTQPVPADDLEYRRGRYRGAVAYARTKRLQVAFTPLLSNRYAHDGIAVHAMHPGWADTPGISDSLPVFRTITRPLLRGPVEGADTIVWLAATQPPPPPGRFWHDRRERPTHYLPGRRDDADRVERAWHYCGAAIGLVASSTGDTRDS